VTSLFTVHDLVTLGCWAVGGLIAARLLFRWEPTRPSRARRHPKGAR
jgi:hypothetical protein